MKPISFVPLKRSAIAFLLLAATAGQAQMKPHPASILDGHTPWRMFEVLKPPVEQLDAGLKPITSNYEWLDRETPPAPESWNQAKFDDAPWLRGSPQAESHTPYLANLFLRGKFEVTDPAQVKDLTLAVTYHGGVIIYLNDHEIARDHIAKDADRANPLAEAYPDNVFVTDKDDLVGTWGPSSKNAPARNRTTTITLSAASMQKGVNVIAIEAVRAPYNKIVSNYWTRHAATDHREGKDPACPYDFNWNTCEVSAITLTASAPAGVVPNDARPKELSLWNSNLLTTDTDADMADGCEPVRPIAIEGPRNAWSSGKIVVGSPKAIAGLKASCSELMQGSSTIPASAIRIRYATPFGDRQRDNPALEALLESPLDTFPATRSGCVVPIWVTVKTPAGAKPGTYTGTVTIEATGEKTLTVPVTLNVANFTEPDTQNYRTWIELMESPDTLATEYNVPLWSDKHWDLIAQSMRYMGEIGSRVVHIPLIAQTNSGNEQSMVRWIKKPDGTYDYDFSIMDKYLDYAEKYMGKPKFVAFTAWEIYLMTPKEEVKITEKDSDFVKMEKSWAAARWDLRGKGPAVTAEDPATHQIATAYLPRFEDAAATPAWKPLFDQLHKKMAARGIENTMLLGMASDYWPSKPEMTTLEEVSGNLPWINQTHGGSHVGSKLDGIATVAYTAYVWNVQYAQDPDKHRDYGWNRPQLYAEFRRFGALNDWPLSSLLLFPELQITGTQRGIGRIGADFWAPIKDKRGERAGYVWDRYPQSKWHSCNLSSHLLDPGPTGPVATSRYEMMHEGVQECEARIAIESALLNPAQKAILGDELANKCQKLLDDRIWQELKAYGDLQLTNRTYATSKNGWGYGCGGEAGHAWYASSGWRAQTQELYALAGEVTEKLAAK
jgi:hypothetical protein